MNSTRKSPQSLFLLVFAALLIILFSYFICTHKKNIAKNQDKKKSFLKSQDENKWFPMRLKIPKINVDAAVEYVGLTAKGTMDVPINTIDVGWFKFGSHPGEKGSAVIAGHFDGEDGTSGVFTNLDKLKKGDKLYINYANGVSLSFVVQGSRIYNPGQAPDVFSSSDSAHLNLVTCDGIWDSFAKSYNKRLVVFSDISNK